MDHNTASAQRQACLRGLRFIHLHSLEGENFEDWDGDYLWCFYCVASTSADPELSALARDLGTACAQRWMASQDQLPPLDDAGEVAYYVALLQVAALLGVENPQLHHHVQAAIPRFTAREYLGFDPRTEPPPRQPGRSRYDIWLDALVSTYTGEGFGTPLGAAYADVLRWLPEMRPYRGPDGGANPEFRDIVLAITHLIYTLNDYSRYRLSPKWLPDEFEFLQTHLNDPLVAGDAELLGEFVDCLRSFGMTASDAALSRSVEFLVASQNADGSWGDVHHPDPHTRYHTAWTAIDALREYAWRDRPQWPESIRQWFTNFQAPM